MEKLRQQIEQRLSAVTGDACFYYENLATGVCFGHAADKPVVAASVIKLAVLIEAFRQMDADAVRANEMFVIARTDKLPSCGALNYLHDGLCVTFRDLCVLMTILSDNTATNLLIKRLGIGNINDTLRMLGAEKMTLNRLLFDREARSRTKQVRTMALPMTWASYTRGSRLLCASVANMYRHRNSSAQCRISP